jgi:hypothetical protein
LNLSWRRGKSCLAGSLLPSERGTLSPGVEDEVLAVQDYRLNILEDCEKIGSSWRELGSRTFVLEL